MSRTVQVDAAAGTLFHVAAAEMDDALQAVTLAYASGIVDPWLTGLTTVTIPDAPAPDTGGLPSPGLLP